MRKLKIENIDCLFDFENQIDEYIKEFDPDIKDTTIEAIIAFAIDCFKIGYNVAKLPVNNV